MSTILPIHAVSPGDALAAMAATTPTAAAAPAAQADFAALLGDGIARLDAGLVAADQQLRAAAAGKDVPVHDLMIGMEEARMQLMFMVEVRNRAVEAYQELMRMQL
jgi:flagellar hook-basal body complex protein FliE